MLSTKFSREVFYKKCFPLFSTYQGVCATYGWMSVCPATRRPGHPIASTALLSLQKRRFGEDATDGFAYLRRVGARRRERRSLEPGSGMQ